MNIGGAQFQSKVIGIGNIKWHVLVSGQGKSLLCVHGFPDTPETFKFQVQPLLGAGFELIFPYLPGYGPSEIMDGKDYYPGNLGRDINALLNALGHEKIYMFGHDYGAMAGYLFAALRPDRVEKLIVGAAPHSASFFIFPPNLRQIWRSRYIFLFQLGPLAVTFMNRGNLKGIDWLWRYWSPTWCYTEEDIAPVKTALSPKEKLSGALGYYRAMVRRGMFDWSLKKSLLSPISVPTLVLAGEKDGCMGLETFAKQGKGFSGPWRMAVIEGAGHFMHREKPEAVNREILAFLGE